MEGKIFARVEKTVKKTVKAYASRLSQEHDIAVDDLMKTWNRVLENLDDDNEEKFWASFLKPEKIQDFLMQAVRKGMAEQIIAAAEELNDFQNEDADEYIEAKDGGYLPEFTCENSEPEESGEESEDEEEKKKEKENESEDDKTDEKGEKDIPRDYGEVDTDEDEIILAEIKNDHYGGKVLEEDNSEDEDGDPLQIVKENSRKVWLDKRNARGIDLEVDQEKGQIADELDKEEAVYENLETNARIFAACDQILIQALPVVLIGIVKDYAADPYEVVDEAEDEERHRWGLRGQITENLLVLLELRWQFRTFTGTFPFLLKNWTPGLEKLRKEIGACERKEVPSRLSQGLLKKGQNKSKSKITAPFPLRGKNIPPGSKKIPFVIAIKGAKKKQEEKKKDVKDDDDDDDKEEKLQKDEGEVRLRENRKRKAVTALGEECGYPEEFKQPVIKKRLTGEKIEELFGYQLDFGGMSETEQMLFLTKKKKEFASTAMRNAYAHDPDKWEKSSEHLVSYEVSEDEEEKKNGEEDEEEKEDEEKKEEIKEEEDEEVKEEEEEPIDEGQGRNFPFKIDLVVDEEQVMEEEELEIIYDQIETEIEELEAIITTSPGISYLEDLLVRMETVAEVVGENSGDADADVEDDADEDGDIEIQSEEDESKTKDTRQKRKTEIAAIDLLQGKITRILTGGNLLTFNKEELGRLIMDNDGEIAASFPAAEDWCDTAAEHSRQAERIYSAALKVFGPELTRIYKEKLAIRGITKEQVHGHATPAFDPKAFALLCREIGQDFKNDLVFTEEAIAALQAAAENYITERFEESGLAAIHRKLTFVECRDLQLVRRIRGERT